MKSRQFSTAEEFIAFFQANSSDAFQYITQGSNNLDWSSPNLERVAKLFTKSEHLIALASANDTSVASSFVLGQSQRMADLFTSAEQVIALAKASKFAGGLVWTLIDKHSAQIAALFQDSQQFIQLVNVYPEAALKLIKEQPARVAALFTSLTKFVQLAQNSVEAAKKLLTLCPDQIGLLFYGASKTSEGKSNVEMLRKVSPDLWKQGVTACVDCLKSHRRATSSTKAIMDNLAVGVRQPSAQLVEEPAPTPASVKPAALDQSFVPVPAVVPESEDDVDIDISGMTFRLV